MGDRPLTPEELGEVEILARLVVPWWAAREKEGRQCLIVLSTLTQDRPGGEGGSTFRFAVVGEPRSVPALYRDVAKRLWQAARDHETRERRGRN